MNEAPKIESDLAVRIAKKLLEVYAIGDFSRFMDEPAEFDAVEEADLADTIREVIKNG